MSGSSPRHIACSLTGTLLQRVARTRGPEAVERVVATAGTPHSAAYLGDPANWISYDEAVAVFSAAVAVTGDPGIARAAGEDTVRQHAGTAVATVLRGMGSPEAILEQVTTAVSKFSAVTEMEPVSVGPGRAVVRARGRNGFARHGHLCEWTKGLLSQPTVLFGLAPAVVEETECAARGARQCLYEVRWDAAAAAGAVDPEQHITALEAQLAAMAQRVESVLATAADLIADEDLDTALARITDRAATAVRAPRYMLAVRPELHGDLHCHHRGLGEGEAERLLELLAEQADPPANWLVADVRSELRVYGHLVAMQDAATGFFAQEREMLTAYARYAATVLDRATALSDARSKHDQARALLQLSRALAAAGGSEEVGRRLITALPAVVDCDRAALFVWDPDAGRLRPLAGTDERLLELTVEADDTPYLRAMIDADDLSPKYFDETSEDPFMLGLMRSFEDEAVLVVPVAAREVFYGVLSLAVACDARRLRPTPELLDRLSGVVAQTATALQNGRLMDRVTQQALTDPLTGLANRQLFSQRVDEAVSEASDPDDSCIALFYIDLDRFKPVNDAYGHATGDLLLRAVAERLELTVRHGDTVARLGGDEFAVLVTGARRPEEIDAVAARIERAFAEPFVIRNASLRLGASVGRAVWPADAIELDSLLQTADSDMYRVKRGRSAAGVR